MGEAYCKQVGSICSRTNSGIYDPILSFYIAAYDQAFLQNVQLETTQRTPCAIDP
ncbi:hypothetical protein VCRA2122O339_200086 [Vibrio crassostreae]|nr:hypothetical protein VCRA2120E331_90100 [Vibrio crassostreae]CAK3156160.1 hypothetical protein VCRA2120E330_100099 [Vibrio crassostreae]CAK3348954.1 hypothetical protein VCRA2122O339_200086 [Vibrio crassostreae]CAK3647106.1 hypothetical protein VCRA2127O345_90100 [Vibrio crassostreae]CAK3684334.1 hypothetical protein VCRA2122O338_90100 [Vibrio crassostreae]